VEKNECSTRKKRSQKKCSRGVAKGLTGSVSWAGGAIFWRSQGERMCRGEKRREKETRVLGGRGTGVSGEIAKRGENAGRGS